MDSVTAARLIELNRDFYNRFGDAFSSTRRRIQPGVRLVLDKLKGDETILDLGCGNGELARELAKRGHRGSYLGVDFSLPLLQHANSQPEGFSATFLQADLTTLDILSILDDLPFDFIFAFAVLHHIPSLSLRLNIIKKIFQWLKPEGSFIHSTWQFLNSKKLKARIQPWDAVLASESEVDTGDYLLDWRSGGKGLRYVHHFDEDELSEIAKEAGFRIADVFYSDGESNNLGLYQVWKKTLIRSKL